MLEFVSDEGDYFVLTDVNGADMFLQNGTFKRLVEFSTIDLLSEYRTFYSNATYASTDQFLDHLRDMVIDPDEVDEVVFCVGCSEPEWGYDDMVSTEDGSVCSSCVNNYTFCDYCDEYVHDNGTVYIDTIDDRVCEGCADSNFSWCDHCDQYYSHDDYHDYDHDDSCDCESPVLSFAIRNDGQDPLANDTPTSIALPAGVISEQGIEAVVRLFQNYAQRLRVEMSNGASYGTPEYVAAYEVYVKWWNFANDIRILDSKWQTKDGNFTKRLSRLAYKNHGIKVTPDQLSEVGNIGNQHSQGASFEVEVTRDLNQSAEAFGHAESCYWQSYYASRCTLKSNGGFGLRSFDPGRRNAWDGGVTGRAWVVPMKMVDGHLTPTFESMSPDAFVVFNGYGDLGGYAPARIMAHMAGMTYRKIDFTLGEAYINAGGYLIAPEEIAQHYTDGELHLYPSDHSGLYQNEQAAKDKAAA